MLKVSKEKILASLIAIIMIVLVIGNVYSLATEGNNNPGTITLTNNSNKANTSANKSNATANTDADLGSEVGATNRSTNNKNKASNTANNTARNTNSSRYSNSNSSSSGLPYAGSNTSIIFIVIALVASAIYAYKKVSDYNI